MAPRSDAGQRRAARHGSGGGENRRASLHLAAPEGRLWVPAEHVPLFVDKGWTKAALKRAAEAHLTPRTGPAMGAKAL